MNRRQLAFGNCTIPCLASNAVLQMWLIAFLINAALFTAFPRIDIAVSSAFFSNRFYLVDSAVIEALRRALLWVAALPALVAICALAVGQATGRSMGLTRAQGAFVLLVPLLSTGVLVNGVLKRFSGRARPEYVADFGGTADFTPALQWADQCSGNCSFVSAETSALTASVIAVFVLTAGRLHSPWARRARSVAMICLALVAGLRIALGRHFLSDVVFAVLFTLGCAIMLARLFEWQKRKTHTNVRINGAAQTRTYPALFR